MEFRVLIVSPDFTEEKFVVLFRKYTSSKYISEVIDGILYKWGKRVVGQDPFVYPSVLALGEEGIPVRFVMRGKNISEVRKDLMLNPRVLRIIDLIGA